MRFLQKVTSWPAAGCLLAAAIAACSCSDGSSGGGTDTSSSAETSANTAVVHELIEAPGFELVMQNCVTCHGPSQFLQQRGDRETWLGLIRWMQQDHGMAKLSAEIEDRIVDYLANHYGPQDSGRRPALRKELMPPNPYAGTAARQTRSGDPPGKD